MAELQKDPMSRADFLGFAAIGGTMGAIIIVPTVGFLLDPVINTDVLGKSNVSNKWIEVGPVSEIPEGEPKYFTIEFPISQTYGQEDIQEESGVSDHNYTIRNTVYLSWKDGEKPGELGDLGGGLSQEQIQTVTQNINVLSNSCAHLGCPVRWIEGEFLCPCHGGIYDINGGYEAGPPPRGMYSYKYEVRQDGKVYVKHDFDVEGGGSQRPYVI
jgi:Rieske Fe-S protein